MSTSNPTSPAAPGGSISGSIFLDISESKPVEDKEIDPFANLDVPRPNDWTIAQAYMCVLLAAVYADKVAVETEIDYVRSLVKRSKTLRGKHQNELAQLDAEVRERMRTRHDYLSEACEAMPKDMHVSMFTHAVDIILADGRMEDSEREFLDELIGKLSMSRADAQRVMQVIFEKNRY